jgi:hypothetical protein
MSKPPPYANDAIAAMLQCHEVNEWANATFSEAYPELFLAHVGVPHPWVETQDWSQQSHQRDYSARYHRDWTRSNERCNKVFLLIRAAYRITPNNFESDFVALYTSIYKTPPPTAVEYRLPEPITCGCSIQ